MPKSKRTPKQVIGWREWVGLPELGVDRIKAKVDTGARTSSLHAFDVELFEEEGRSMVRFLVHPEQRSSLPAIPAEAPLLDSRLVRNPGGGGREELRPVISTELRLGDRVWDIELTLSSRDEMGFRMLLGRSAVRRRFVVDPGRSFLAEVPSPVTEGGER